MKKRHEFRPTLQPLEQREVLSLSLSSFFHSIFPFIHDKKTATPKKAHTVHVSPLAKQTITGTAKRLYAGPQGKAPANSTANEASSVKTHTVTMYGPFTARGAALNEARRLIAARQTASKG